MNARAVRSLRPLVFVLAGRHWGQCHARQRLASCHATLQVRGRPSVSTDNDEAAGLDEERGLLGVLLGLRILFEEGNGSVEGGMKVSEVGQRCL